MLGYRDSLYKYVQESDYPLVEKHLLKMEYLAQRDEMNKQKSTVYYITGERKLYNELEELLKENPDCPVELVCISFGLRDKDTEDIKTHRNVSAFRLFSVHLNTYALGLFKSEDILSSVSEEYTATDTTTHRYVGKKAVAEEEKVEESASTSVHHALNNYSKYKNLDAKNKLIVAEAITNLIDNLSE